MNLLEGLAIAAETHKALKASPKRAGLVTQTEDLEASPWPSRWRPLSFEHRLARAGRYVERKQLDGFTRF